MPAPIRLELDIDLEAHLARFRGIDPETGRELSEPQTLEEIVIERAAQIVAQRAISDGNEFRDLRAAARHLIDARVADVVLERVDAVLSTSITPTDGFGNPKGEPTTLTAIVAERVDAALKVSPPDSFGNRRGGSGTVLEQAIEQAIKGNVQKAVKAAVDAERDAIVARVAAESAVVLTEGLRRAVKTS